MTYSITARREKARFLCSDLDIEGAEFWKRKLERDGWTAIVIRDGSKPQTNTHSHADALECMGGIDEHKQTRNAPKSICGGKIAAFIGILALLMINAQVIYTLAMAFPEIAKWLQAFGWCLFAFGLVVVTVKFAKGFRK